MRYVLTAVDFERLVNGEVVEIKDHETGETVLELALEDMGYLRMLEVVGDALTAAQSPFVQTFE